MLSLTFFAEGRANKTVARSRSAIFEPRLLNLRARARHCEELAVV